LAIYVFQKMKKKQKKHDEDFVICRDFLPPFFEKNKSLN